MSDLQVNTDNFTGLWDEFLKSKISCQKCGQGPSNYSTIWANGKIISKYDGFCSGGCAMTYDPYSKYTRSRCVTLINIKKLI